MAVRTFAITGALVVGAALAYESASGEPHTDSELRVTPAFQAVQKQDSTYLERLASALKHVTTARDSTALTRDLQYGGRWKECPMPVATDSTSLPIPTLRSSTKHTMPVLKVPCFNPLFAGVRPDSQ